MPAMDKLVSIAPTISTNSDASGRVKGVFRKEEVSAVSKMINKLLKDETELAERIPINPENEELFYKLQDGLIGIALLNMVEEDRVDIRTINDARLRKSMSIGTEEEDVEGDVKENLDHFFAGC